MKKRLRLCAEDSAELLQTGHALADAQSIPDPPLRILCQHCGALLARAGDTEHGALFTASWECERPLHFSVVENGRKLSRAKATKWRGDHEVLVQRRGKPMDSPERHGVVSLLELPAGMAPDYPDLLVRCIKHGDLVLDRSDVLAWLRQANIAPVKRKVTVRKPFSEYTLPSRWPGESESLHQTETWRLKADVMSIEEFERKRAARDAEYRRRNGDVP